MVCYAGIARILEFISFFLWGVIKYRIIIINIIDRHKNLQKN